MVIGSMQKQPGETIRLSIDWSPFVSAADNEEITGVTTSITPATGTPVTVSPYNAPPFTTGYFMISSGEDGVDYWATFTATTSLGQVIESEVIVNVEEIARD